MRAIGKCPWPGCGGEGAVMSVGRDNWVACSFVDCRAHGPVCDTPEAAITAWNRLATPDPERVTGRVRWEGMEAYLGKLYLGRVVLIQDGAILMGTIPAAVSSKYPTEASARAALVAAVKEAIGDE